MDWVGFARDNWAVITQAPWAFVTCAALFLGIGMALQAWLHTGASMAKDERLKLAEAKVADYRERLAGKSPDEAAARIDALERRVTAIEPRAFSASEMVSLTTILSQRSAGVIVSRDVSSADADFIYHQAIDMFRLARWAVQDRVIFGLKNNPASGITLLTRPSSNQEGADLIRRALKIAGIAFEEMRVEEASQDDPLPQLNFSSPRRTDTAAVP